MRNVENIFWMSVASRKFMYRDSGNFFDTKTDFILRMLGFKDWFDGEAGFVYLDRETDFILGMLGFKDWFDTKTGFVLRLFGQKLQEIIMINVVLFLKVLPIKD